ncbi:LOG family protein [Leeia oryzae]|uniref:LOG family protein n=1 Tax=Leeia oryzae TaxID=356662 RepID=UPI000370CC63|nr:TIGR00730 family Rossman fold protein [Leeia oryzae]
MMKLAVFCGSHAGHDAVFTDAAIALGKALADQDIELVYGGGKVGLMGEIANAVMQHGGVVTGVIPEALKQKELAHTGITRLHVVDDMHQRKNMMASLSDGFIAMPGAAGTLEEFFEVWTWAQLGYHQKPCAILNVNGFFDPLIEMMQKVVAHGFMRDAHLDMIIISQDPAEILRQMKEYKAPGTKWS